MHSFGYCSKECAINLFCLWELYCFFSLSKWSGFIVVVECGYFLVSAMLGF